MTVESLIESSLTDLVSLLTKNGTCGNLIFPHYRDYSVRYSEQELRQLFLKNVETNDNKTYFYSVETPTKLVYRFTNTEIPKVKDPNNVDDNDKDNYKSARFDVSLYNKPYKNNDKASNHIEFKYGNPDQKNAICKDFLKLISEVDLTKEKRNFFVHYHYVKEDKGESASLQKIFKKYCESINNIEKSFKNEKNHEKREALLKNLSQNLPKITVYFLYIHDKVKKILTYHFSLDALKNYTDGTKYNDFGDKTYLNEEVFKFGEEIHFKEIKTVIREN